MTLSLMAAPAPSAPAPVAAKATAQVPEEKRTTVAVAPMVTSSSQEYRWMGLGLAHALVSQLLELKDVNTLTVRQLNSAIRHDNLKADELNDDKVIQHLSTQTGADYFVGGNITAEWPTLSIIARVYSVKDKKMVKTLFISTNIEDFFTAEQNLAKEVFAVLGLKAEPAMAAIGTKNLYAYHQAMLGYDLLNWQSMSPRSTITLPPGSLKKAKVHFDKAVTLDPKYSDAHAGLGMAQSFMLDHEAARKSFAQALQLAPNGFQAQAVLGKYYSDLRTGRTDEALRGLEAGQKARPGFVHATGYLAETYNHMGRHREALSVFERYRRADPSQPWVMVQIGYTKAKLKRFDEAIKDTQAGVAMLPDSVSFRVELASRYIDADKLVEAEELLKKTLETNPKNAKLYLRLGYVYLLQKKIDAAIPIFERSLAEAELAEEGRTRAVAHFDLARCFALKKDNAKALSHLDDAVKGGYRDLEDLENEPDLDELRKDAKFAPILALAKKPMS